MRTTTVTIGYWTLMALGFLAVATTGVDLVEGGHTALGQVLGGLLPGPVYPVVAGVLSLALAAAATAVTAPAHRAGRGSLLPLLLGGLVAAALGLLAISVELLALVGYLPLLVVLARFDETMRDSLAGALGPGILAQFAVLVGVLLWALVVRRQLSGRRSDLPRWSQPAAAARWGRVAVVAAVVPPLTYAATRFSWLVYPLGFDRASWEEAHRMSTLLPGVWLASFAVVGAVLTLGLTQRWGEVFPRWVPRLAGRPVPVALAVVPAGLVALLLVPAGISMIRRVLGPETPFDPLADWAAYGPTLLWPLWGVALGVATVGYALRRREAWRAPSADVPAGRVSPSDG